MAKLSLVKLNMRFGLAVATKMISCTSCGNLVSKGTPFWAASAAGKDGHYVVCCHVCSNSLFHSLNNAARVFNNQVQRLNFFYGTQYKWTSTEDVCAPGHELTEIMYRDFLIDRLAWLVVGEDGFYNRLSDIRGS